MAHVKIQVDKLLIPEHISSDTPEIWGRTSDCSETPIPRNRPLIDSILWDQDSLKVLLWKQPSKGYSELLQVPETVPET